MQLDGIPAPDRVDARFRTDGPPRLGGVPAAQSGAVTLRAVASPGVLGPPATGRFAARRTLPSPFRPFAELRAMRPRAGARG